MGVTGKMQVTPAPTLILIDALACEEQDIEKGKLEGSWPEGFLARITRTTPR